MIIEETERGTWMIHALTRDEEIFLKYLFNVFEKSRGENPVIVNPVTDDSQAIPLPR